MKESSPQYDVIVIGGGPSGMMAAGVAASRGLSVLLLEKNHRLGEKLRITGGGRCNITNAEFDTRTLLSHYGPAQSFLFSAFAQFGVQSTLDFFASIGLTTKVEERQRVFPITDSAESVAETLITYLKQNKVTVRTNSTVASLHIENNTVASVTLTNNETLTANHLIVATGGLSRPETGSTGDGFTWLKNLGHSIVAPDPSLVPITLHDSWVPTLAGVTLPEVKIRVMQNEKKLAQKTGRLLFTHVGVSGPTILNLSRLIGEHLSYDEVTLLCDLFPTTDHGDLDTLLTNLFHTHSNKLIKNTSPETLLASVWTVVLSLADIAHDTPCHSVTKEERKRLVQILKALPLHVKGLLGADKAIVTSGGVPLTEVDTRTMQSRRYPNLYLTGDILNIDRPSGGYSLQLCWTTGYVASNNIPLP